MVTRGTIALWSGPQRYYRSGSKGYHASLQESKFLYHGSPEF